MMRTRCTGGVCHQSSKASAAACTALSTTSAPHIGTSAMTAPVEGLWTGVVGTPSGVDQDPLIRMGQGRRDMAGCGLV